MTTIHGNAASSVCHGLPGHDASNPTNARSSMQGGQAVFENDNYRIAAGDDNTVTVHNKHSGETYQAWGDPHMKIDGKDSFDFWGTTSIKLEDGTKLTIDTTPDKNNPGATLSSKVTITNGDYGVQISGIDTNRCGDLKIDEAKGWGRVLDAVVKDGNVLHENPSGQGFLGVDKQGDIRRVDQRFIDETDLRKGGGRPQPNPLREVFAALLEWRGNTVAGPCSAGMQELRPISVAPPEKSPFLAVQRTNPNQFDPVIAGLERAVGMNSVDYSTARFQADMLLAAGGDETVRRQLINSYGHAGHVDQGRSLATLAASKDLAPPARYAEELKEYARFYGLTEGQAAQHVKSFQLAFNSRVPEGNSLGTERYRNI